MASKRRRKTTGRCWENLAEEDWAGSALGERVRVFETQGETAISGNFGEYGNPSNLSEHRGADADEKVLENAEAGGGVGCFPIWKI